MIPLTTYNQTTSKGKNIEIMSGQQNINKNARSRKESDQEDVGAQRKIIPNRILAS